MPNQPQATSPRRVEGRCAPVPKDERISTGKGMPYLVPGWAFKMSGTSTMALPSRMVSTASRQFMPEAIMPAASM